MNDKLEELIQLCSQNFLKAKVITPPSYIYIPSSQVTLNLAQRLYRGIHQELILNSIRVENKRKGAGTQVMIYLIETARNLGYSSIVLNKAESLGFFRKFGFEEDDREESCFPDYKLVL
ncbi:MAG: GNAT family N-acetyltransferase [Nanoarchaeota archaeon]|nr:GNAT family N-acetyltransferase [Nanoarchaeota archaeon]